jgi:DNA-binding MarR family transcriptional regulator
VARKTLNFQRVLAELLEQIGPFAHGDAFLKGLNPAQWAALRYFARANQVSRAVCASALFHGTDRGTASQTVKALVEKGTCGSDRGMCRTTVGRNADKTR